MNITKEGLLNWSYIDTCKCEIECLTLNQYLPTISLYMAFFLSAVLFYFMLEKEQAFPNKDDSMRDYWLYVAFLLVLGFQIAVWLAIWIDGVI